MSRPERALTRAWWACGGKQAETPEPKGKLDTMSGSEAELLALMRTDAEVQKRRGVEEAAVLETAGPRPRRRRPGPTDDKINDAFERATSV